MKKKVVSFSNNFLPFVTTEAVTGTHDNYHERYYQNECQTYEYHFFFETAKTHNPSKIESYKIKNTVGFSN